jgi:hypothetical protein
MARIAHNSSGSVRRPVPKLMEPRAQRYGSSARRAYRGPGLPGSARPAAIRSGNYSHARSRPVVAFLVPFAGAIAGVVLARILSDIIARELSREKKDTEKESRSGSEPEPPPPSLRDVVVAIGRIAVKVGKFMRVIQTIR